MSLMRKCCCGGGVDCCQAGQDQVCDFNIARARLEGHRIVDDYYRPDPDSDCSATPTHHMHLEFDYNIQMTECGGDSAQLRYDVGDGITIGNPDGTPWISNLVWTVDGVAVDNGFILMAAIYRATLFNGSHDGWEEAFRARTNVGLLDLEAFDVLGVDLLTGNVRWEGGCSGFTATTVVACANHGGLVGGTDHITTTLDLAVTHNTGCPE